MQITDMKLFSGIEYLAIDVANAFGKQESTGFKGDKATFEERIQWVQDNFSQLEALADEVDEDVILYKKAVLSLRRACRGEDIGHIVYLDATCSGIQIMSALTGCHKGAMITGLINPDVRADAYKTITDTMNHLLKERNIACIEVERKDAKDAIMPCTYGSKEKPEEYFGTGEILKAFYDACHREAKGAFQLLDILRSTWQKFAMDHTWQLADGFVSVNKVTKKVTKQVHIAELFNYNMSIQTKEHQGKYNGVSNVANVIHSIDGFVLREIIRRCNYNKSMVANVYALVKEFIEAGAVAQPLVDEELSYYLKLAQTQGQLSAVIIRHINADNVAQLGVCIPYMKDLLNLMERMLSYEPFEVITVHDAFGAHPDNCNVLRYWYREMLAELAESDMLQDIIRQIIHNPQYIFEKHTSSLPNLIRKSNYAIC